MFCSKCGTQNEAQAVFCSSCGTHLSQGDPVETEISVESEMEEMTIQKPVRRKRSKKGMWIGIGVGAGAVCAAAVVCIALVLLVGAFFNTPRSVVRGYMRSVQHTNTSQFMKLIPKKVQRGQYLEFYTDKNAVKTSDNRSDVIKENLDDEFFIWHMFYYIESIEDVPASSYVQLQEEYEQLYRCKITGAKRVKVTVILFHDFETTTKTYNLSLVRIGTKWYLGYAHYPERLWTDIYLTVLSEIN